MKIKLPTQPRKRQAVICLLIVAAAGLASASIFATGPRAKPEGPTEKAWPVSVINAKPQTLRPGIAAFGRLESNRVATLRSDVIAKVVSVNVNEGEWVEAGELLVQLDDRDLKLQLLERTADLKQSQANLTASKSQLALERQSATHFKSKLDVAQAKLQRHRDLMEKRLIARGLLDEVTAAANAANIEYQDHKRKMSDLPNQIAANEAHLAKAQALVEQAKLALERTSVIAPFAGPIIAVHTAPGDHSNLSQPLVEMADANGFEVRVQIPEVYTRQFQQAIENTQPIDATTADGDELTLSRLAHHVRAGQTGLDAFFVLKRNNNSLPAPIPALGRVFNLAIELPEQTRLIALPLPSIYEHNKVYSVKDNRLVSHTVERVGERERPEHGYEVLIRASDIPSGTPIITTQLPKAMTGLLVEIPTVES